MVQTSVQFTPTQVLQAARRAEAEGKMDYALQFYRHLVEQHGHSPEAQEAREGLFRIAEWRWGEARLARSREAEGTHQGPAAVTPPPVNQATAANQRVVNVGGGAQNARPAGVPPHPPTADPGKLPQIIAREHSADKNGQPQFQARFRAARVFAHTLSGLGWLTLLAGIIGAALALAGTVAEVSAAGLFGLPMGVIVGVPGAVLGLLLVVTGQLAAALLESSNATLELVAYERGRAGF